MAESTLHVESSVIEKVTHNTKDNRLDVYFHNGNHATYFDVSLEEFATFGTTPSPGRYYNDRIKRSKPTRRGPVLGDRVTVENVTKAFGEVVSVSHSGDTVEVKVVLPSNRVRKA